VCNCQMKIKNWIRTMELQGHSSVGRSVLGRANAGTNFGHEEISKEMILMPALLFVSHNRVGTGRAVLPPRAQRATIVTKA
jgi:hypothetical protein